jgi:hypothetical protein
MKRFFVIDAPQVLIPLHHEKVGIVGVSREPLPHLFDLIVNDYCLKEVFRDV